MSAHEFSKSEFDSLTWDVINKYYNINKGYQLVKHQIESFNDFIEHKLEQIIKGFNDIEITHQYQPETENFKYLLTITINTPVLNNPEIYEKDGSKKTMTPNDARQRNFTYSSNLTVNMNIRTQTWSTEENKYLVENKTLQGVNLGKIPIMVKSAYCILSNKSALINSGECKYDYGGYFLINGNEKVVIMQGRISENITYVFLNNKVSTYSHIAEIRSVQENKLGVPKITTLKLSAKANQFGRYIRVNIHHIKNDIPLFILFKALGLRNDKEIIKYIVYDLDNPINKFVIKELIGCVEEANAITCQKDALEYLAKFLNITGYSKEVLNNKNYRINIVRNVLEREFLPHVGQNFYKKALYLGYMVNKLIKCFIGLKEYDDRDSYINKRVDTPGVLMQNLFRQYYGKMIKDMKNMIQKEINMGGWKATNKFSNVITKINIYKIIKSTIIDSGIRYALATGNWGIKNNKNKQGVAQVLNRMTYSAAISHMRRVNTPVEKSGKLIQPRKLHSTQWGVICPSETPEGASVGLVQNLAMMASVTICSNSENVRSQILDMGCQLFNSENIEIFEKNTKIIINGDIIGVHENPDQLYKDLKILKRKGCINIYTGIVWRILDREIQICTEGGRCVRPMYIVDPESNNIRLTKDIKSKTWQDLLIGTFGNINVEDNVIEFLDVEEGNKSMIAMKYKDLFKGNKGSLEAIKYTHLEIHPSLILGVLASSIPFSDHNQAPRNTYQSAQAKQAIGIYASNYKNRYDTMGHILNSPQKPLIRTKMASILNQDKMPNGINAIVAIACYTGFNQEDSVLINKSAVDNGLFVSTYFRTYKEQNNKNHSNGEEEFFVKPEIKGIKPYNYSKLEEDGFVPENTFIQNGDIIIGKCMPNKNGNQMTYKDNSVPFKNSEMGFIDRNCANDKYFTNTNGDGYTFAKVRVRNDRSPTIGDKVSSRSGQKGTIGILYNREDMPFTKDGIVPDIIMNPHAIPSRMTIGQLLESIMGKACCFLGTHGDATPFNEIDSEEVSEVLQSCGMERYGNEIMYNSRTGEQILTDIFIGPTYYQRLKHMTADKIHSRANNGPLVSLTRQPSDGRARDGGLRLGEMEMECLWTHGTLQFMKERIMECSDNYRVFICKACGMMAIVNPLKNIHCCRSCKNNTNFAEIRIPYAAKLLLQEIQTMSIATRFITSS